jgi:protein involved in polysaccharide export with SLBB domain
MRMSSNFQILSRHAFSAMALTGLAALSLQAQAQAPLSGNLPAQLGGLMGGAAAGSTSMGGFPVVPNLMTPPIGFVQAPGMPARADMGADDAPRNNLTPLRPPKPQAPSQFQRFVQESTGQLLPIFGAQLFDNPLAYAADMAAPAPAEYVLGPGDEVRIQIWGSTDYAGIQTLDRNGQIYLPKIGTLQLSGVQVKNLEAVLRKQVSTVFNNVTVNASLGKLRGITVYVVGQAQQPGTYNLNSLSTLINAVFASGGPGPNGSMRNIRLQRNGKTVTTLDLYDFMAQGDKSKDAALQPGDVIMIPPAGPRVALTGATDQGAIYELKAGTTVQDVLALSGGVPALASAQKALVERIDPQQPAAPRQVQNLTLHAQGLTQPLRDGDVITLLPMSPAFGNAVTLQGAVAQPLRHAFQPGMRVQDLIPDREALIAPDFYKRRNQLVQNRVATLRAQGFTPQQIQALERAQQLPDDISLTTDIIKSSSATGQNNANNPNGNDTKNATGGNNASGHANFPVSTLEQEQQALVEREARNQRNTLDRVRGFTEQINWDYAVIERLNKADLRTQLIPFNLGKAIVQKDPAHNLELQAGDVITIMSSADLRLPTERQTRLVRIEGEVVAPGVYQALPGETLPQLIQRVGGLTPQAYLFGAEFTRETVRKQQQQNLDQLVRRLESQMQSAGATLGANLTGERAAQAATLQQQQQQQMKSQIDRLKSLRSKGRVALELDPSKTALTVTIPASASLVLQNVPQLPLEDGDAFIVPSQPAFIAAAGSVNNDNVFVYKPGKSVGDIIRSAGLTEDAEPSEAFVLRADGSIISRRAGGFFSSFETTKVMPGDTVVVPAKVDRENNYNFVVRALKDWTQILSNLGIGAAAIQSLKN